MPEQEGADDVLGGIQLAVGEQRRRRHDLGRQMLQRRDMRGRRGRVGGIAASSR